VTWQSHAGSAPLRARRGEPPYSPRGLAGAFRPVNPAQEEGLALWDHHASEAVPLRHSGQGNALWYPPLKEACSPRPQPDRGDVPPPFRPYPGCCVVVT